MLAVIMAGGEGTRLRPYTQIIPKPLLPLGEKPILEIVIRQLVNEGFKELVITTGYHGDLIRTYFQDGARFGASIDYTVEEIKMGTAGALSLIDRKMTEPFLIINGDILTDLGLSKFLEAHRQSGAALTVGIVKFSLNIPYGVVTTNGDVFESIREKPQVFFDIGAGIYAASPEVLEFIPRGRKMDFPELIGSLKQEGRVVRCSEIVTYWKDIGVLKDFEEANREVHTWTEDRLYHRSPGSLQKAA